MRRRFAATFGGLPAAYWTLWVGTLINRLGAFVVPFLGLYLTGPRGLPIDVAGAIVSLYGLGTVAAGLVGGVLADRLGRRATLLLGLTGGALAMVALAFARHGAVIGVIVFLVALLSDLARPAAGAMIADLVPPEDRLRAYGLQYWAVNIGFSVAPVLAGVMAHWSFVWLFIGDAATTLVFALFVYLRLPESRTHAPPAAPLWHGPGVVFRDRLYMAFAAATLLVAIIYKQTDVSMPVDMVRHGIPPHIYGLVIALNGVLIVLFSPMASRRLGGFDRMRTVAVAAVLSGLGFGVYVFAGGPAVYALGVVLWTFGEIASSTASSAITAERAPADARGRYQGVFAMTWGLGAFIAPTLGGLVYRRLSPAALWIGCAVLGLIAALVYLRLGAAFRRSRSA